jgi:hypothetical protein
MIADEYHPCTSELLEEETHPCSYGTFYEHVYHPCENGRSIRLEQEIHNSLHNSSENPFMIDFQVPKRGMGAKRDIFLSDCVRPHVDSPKAESIGTTDPEIWEGNWPEYLEDYSSEGFECFHRLNELEINWENPPN